MFLVNLFLINVGFRYDCRHNFDCISCESCKTFFRRNAFRVRHLRYEYILQSCSVQCTLYSIRFYSCSTVQYSTGRWALFDFVRLNEYKCAACRAGTELQQREAMSNYSGFEAPLLCVSPRQVLRRRHAARLHLSQYCIVLVLLPLPFYSVPVHCTVLDCPIRIASPF